LSEYFLMGGIYTNERRFLPCYAFVVVRDLLLICVRWFVLSLPVPRLYDNRYVLTLHSIVYDLHHVPAEYTYQLSFTD